MPSKTVEHLETKTILSRVEAEIWMIQLAAEADLDPITFMDSVRLYDETGHHSVLSSRGFTAIYDMDWNKFWVVYDHFFTPHSLWTMCQSVTRRKRRLGPFT